MTCGMKGLKGGRGGFQLDIKIKWLVVFSKQGEIFICSLSFRDLRVPNWCFAAIKKNISTALAAGEQT